MRSPFFKFVVCFFVFANLLFVNVLADEISDVFTVKDIRVDVSADSAVQAQEKAFGTASVKAFDVLAKRVLGKDGASTLVEPDENEISSLIRDFEVTGERFSATRYVGTYTFRFRQNATRKIFEKQDLSYTDITAQPVLILPFFQTAGQQEMLIWGQGNKWMDAWNSVDEEKLTSGLVPIVVPLGDVEDMQNITGVNGLAYDTNSLAQMVRRYGSGEAVIALAVPRADNFIDIHLYRTDGQGALYVRTLPNIPTYSDAVDMTISALQTDWKEKMSVPGDAQGNTIQAVSYFNNIEDFIALQNAMSRFNSSGRISLDISSISIKSAKINILFHGNEEMLKNAFDNSDLELIKYDAMDVMSFDPLAESSENISGDGENYYEIRLKR